MLPTVEKVSWIDCASAVSEPWVAIDDLPTPGIQSSVGYVVKETDTYIVIAAHLDLTEDGEVAHVCGPMTIPLETILARQIIPIP